MTRREDSWRRRMASSCGAATGTQTIRLGLQTLVRDAAYERLRSLRGTEPHAREAPRRREKPLFEAAGRTDGSGRYVVEAAGRKFRTEQASAFGRAKLHDPGGASLLSPAKRRIIPHQEGFHEGT